MKKTLLFSTVLFASTCAFAQEGTNVTPSNYDFNYAETVPFSPQIFKNVNIGGDSWNSFNFADEYDNGLIVMTTYAGGVDVEILARTQKSWTLVDMGGEVGQVLCYAGVNSNVKTVLESIYPNNDWSAINPDENNPGAIGLNFWLDPDQSFTGENGFYYHVSMLVNAYCPNLTESQPIFNKIGGETVTNNVRCFLAPGITTYDFVEVDADGDPLYDNEGNVISKWDPTRWVKYEFDFSVPEAAGDPARIRMEFPGTIANKGLFIKDIKITAVEGDAETLEQVGSYTGDGVGEFTKTYVTYELGEGGEVGPGPEVSDAPEKLYILGNIKDASWSETASPAMTKVSDNEFTIDNVVLTDSGDGNAYFAFASELGTWDIVNSNRYVPESDATRNVTVNMPTEFKYYEGSGSDSWIIAAGTYSFSMNFSTNMLTVTNEAGVTSILDENAPVEYYNLQGVKVTNPEKGMYIIKQGKKTAKVIVR